MPAYVPFHYAFTVDDLIAARRFYQQVLGATTGRQSDTWIDFNFYGHQLVAHLDDGMQLRCHNQVDGDQIPVPHFGVVLSLPEWCALRDRLLADATTDWILEPKTRFAGDAGEQSTLFVRDPAGNALEFKAFADLGNLFKSAED